jgi:hypothetical protein
VASIETAGGPSNQVDVTLTVGRPASGPPTVGRPGVPTTPTPVKHLPFTGAPVLAELDLALIIAVIGITFVTAANRFAHRRQ